MGHIQAGICGTVGRVLHALDWTPWDCSTPCKSVIQAAQEACPRYTASACERANRRQLYQENESFGAALDGPSRPAVRFRWNTV